MIWNYVIAALIGIVIYQVVTMIVYVVSKENEDAVVITAMLVPLGLWNCVIIPIVRKVWLAWCQKHLNQYRLCFRSSNGDVGDGGTFYATDKIVANFTQDETQRYFIKKTKDGKDFKSTPFTSQIYKGQQNFNGWDMNKFKPQQI